MQISKVRSINYVLLLGLMSSLILLTNVNSSIAKNKDNLTVPVGSIIGSAFDKDDNLIVVGDTSDNNIFIGKYAPDGKLLWQDVFGGSDEDVAEAFILDPSGRSIIVRSYQNSIVISIHDTDGEILYDSPIAIGRLGGFQLDSKGNTILVINPLELDNNDDIGIYKISMTPGSAFETMWTRSITGSVTQEGTLTIDLEDNIIVHGMTHSPDLSYISLDAVQPNLLGSGSPFLLKFDANGSPLWGTYFGSSSVAVDTGAEVSIDGENNIVAIGELKALGDGFQLTDAGLNFGGKDIITAKFSPTGQLRWANRVGGPLEEVLKLKLIDSNDGIVVVLGSSSKNIDISTNSFDSTLADRTDPGESTITVRYDTEGNTIFNTFIGTGPGTWQNTGSNPSQITGNPEILLEMRNGNFAIVGEAVSNDLQVSNPFQSNYAGNSDIYLTILRVDGSPITSTYIGGDGKDTVQNMLEDKDNNLIITGTTTSTNFPSSTPYELQGFKDNFVMKLDVNGKLLWSLILGSDGSEDFSENGLKIDGNSNYYLIGTTSSEELDGLGEETVDFDIKWAFTSKISETGDLQWTIALGINRIAPEPKSNLLRNVVIISTVLTLGIVGYFIRGRYFTHKLEALNYNDSIGKIISPLLADKPELLFLFTGTALVDDKNLDNDIKNEIPGEIFDFKDILHPVRLAIIKLVYDNTTMTTVELLELIKIDNSDVYNHISVLKKKGYIITRPEFIDGTTKTVVMLEASGVRKFQLLTEVFVDFLTSAPNLDRYMEKAIELRSKQSDQLYPAGN